MSRYLDMVDHPSHVKNLTLEQLQQLAEELRYELITKLAKNGGHLGPNLGVVELTIALHYVFSTPHDKFVWDVSHQSYVHKLLTGRKDRFHTIRTTGGLNGFSLRTESEHDCYGAGHAGTALSAALGMAAARDQRGTDENIVSIFGDAALTNGISFEALNNIAHTTKRFVSVLNDNEWSIAKNVGAIASYLNKLITNPSYNRLHKDLQRWIKRMPKGELVRRLGHKAEEALKGAVTEVALRHNPAGPHTDGRGGFGSSLIFEELGLRYVGPIDGHNLSLLIHSLEYAKQSQVPVVLHVLTEKGKGYEAALKQPEKFHGLGPYDIVTGSNAAGEAGYAAELPGCVRQCHGEALCERQFNRWNHRRDADRNGFEGVGKGDAAAVLRRRDCRGARGALRGRHGHDGLPSRLRDLFDVPPARLRLHCSRCGVAGFARDFLHGSRRPFRQ
jgi:1-deoxy-D-xylulose-5-phosphate synthase